MPQLHQQVVKFLISQDEKNGVHIAVIARGLSSKVNAEELGLVAFILQNRDLMENTYSDVIGWLMDSGYLYNTIDDDHYALSR